MRRAQVKSGRQRHRLQPAQHAELASWITQPIEDHEAQASQHIDFSLGAAPNAGQFVKAQRPPELRERPYITGVPAFFEAQTVKSRRSWRQATCALKGCDQGVNVTTGLQSAQGTDGALARLAIFIAIGLDQLRVAPGTGLSDFDEHSPHVKRVFRKIKLLLGSDVPIQLFFNFGQFRPKKPMQVLEFTRASHKKI